MKSRIFAATTNVPKWLHDYAVNARDYGQDDIEFILVGDRKMPAGTGTFCAGTKRRTGCRFSRTERLYLTSDI